MPPEELESQKPSERLVAANRLVRSARPSDKDAISRALAAETVPRIRSVLQAALAQIERPSTDVVGTTKPDNTRSAIDDPAVVLSSMAGMIEHELSAAVGWVEYTASRTLPDFDQSEVKTSINALQRRINGLVTLARANQRPRRVRMSLSEVVAMSVPPNFPSTTADFEGQSLDDEIVTDPDLLSLVLINALQNAYEASTFGEQSNTVYVTHQVTETDFWVTVSNSYRGASFQLEDVQATGVSHKADHRGLGLRVILIASSALGYDVSLLGTGNVANFRLRGLRFAQS